MKTFLMLLSLALGRAIGFELDGPEHMVAVSNSTSEEDVYAGWMEQKPFTKDPTMDIIGLCCMAFVMILSNAGGISGAGTNMPFLLIFLQLRVKQAIPLTGFIAVVSNIGKFSLNYNKKHPHNHDRVLVNYEVVMVTMPAVFIGSLIGVLLN